MTVAFSGCEIARGLTASYVPKRTGNAERPPTADARARCRESAIHPPKHWVSSRVGLIPRERDAARTAIASYPLVSERVANIFDLQATRRAWAVFSFSMGWKGPPVPSNSGPLLVGA